MSEGKISEADATPAKPTLRDKLQEDMKVALKAGEKDRLMVIRMLLSDVKNIDLAPKPLTEEQAVEAYVKKLRKSLEEYEKIGQSEQAAKLKQEIEIAGKYLPAKAGAAETEALVRQFLAANSFTAKDAGKATGMFMKAHGAAVDPGIASGLIRKILTPG
jgi:uncharacterized protein